MWVELEKPENADIFFELNDSKFLSRTHGTRSTYADGCRGPLCRWSERERGRARHAKRQAAKGKGVLNMPPGPARDRDDLIRRVIAWHRGVRMGPDNPYAHQLHQGNAILVPMILEELSA